ncbi:MAG TPA: sporulation integral membrane protein YtvI [Clostridia bacterium]|nr:sporulation integral membrane protein YtvI [Clostridia bacterium]
MDHQDDKSLKSLIFVLRVLGWLLAAFLVYYYLFPAGLAVLRFLLPLALPFIIGLVLAALFEPIVEFVSRKLKVSRAVSVIGTMLLVIGGTVTGLTWMIIRAIMEIVNLSYSFPMYAERIAVSLQYALSQARILYFSLDLPADWQDFLVRRMEQVSHTVLEVLNWSLGLLTAVPNVVLILFFAIVSSYFFSKDKENIAQALYRILPAQVAGFLHNMGGQAGNAILGYLRAQIILMLITMGQTLVGLYVLGVDYTLLITLVVGFLDLLPVLGPGLIFVPWMAMAFLMGNLRLAVSLLILYGIISLVRQLIQPKVVGDSIGIHPLETLVSLYVGLKVMGVAGLVLGPILVVIVKGCWRYYRGGLGWPRE